LFEASKGRIVLVNSKLLDTTGKIMELARDLEEPRNDWYENIVFKDLYTCRDGVAIVTSDSTSGNDGRSRKH